MTTMTHARIPDTVQTEFDRWWQSPGRWIEPVNQRRGGESGVQLLLQRDTSRPELYCKRQSGHVYRSLRYPLGRPTIVRELQAYRAFARLGIRTPKLVYGSARHERGQWQALLVTEALPGFIDLQAWYASARPAAQTRAMLASLAQTLARLHHGGWQHGCCYAKHIFLKASENALEEVEVALLDLEKSRHRWRKRKAARRDLDQLKRHGGTMPAADYAFLLGAYQAAMGGLQQAVRA